MGKVAMAFGLEALKAVPGSLDPEQLLARATEVIRTEVRQTVQEILSDENSVLFQTLEAILKMH